MVKLILWGFILLCLLLPVLRDWSACERLSCKDGECILTERSLLNINKEQKLPHMKTWVKTYNDSNINRKTGSITYLYPYFSSPYFLKSTAYRDQKNINNKYQTGGIVNIKKINWSYLLVILGGLSVIWVTAQTLFSSYNVINIVLKIVPVIALGILIYKNQLL